MALQAHSFQYDYAYRPIQRERTLLSVGAIVRLGSSSEATHHRRYQENSQTPFPPTQDEAIQITELLKQSRGRGTSRFVVRGDWLSKVTNEENGKESWIQNRQLRPVALKIVHAPENYTQHLNDLLEEYDMTLEAYNDIPADSIAKPLFAGYLDVWDEETGWKTSSFCCLVTELHEPFSIFLQSKIDSLKLGIPTTSRPIYEIINSFKNFTVTINDLNRAGIAHGDANLHNALICQRYVEGEGRFEYTTLVLLIDFELSYKTRLEGGVTIRGAGTPRYMSMFGLGMYAETEWNFQREQLLKEWNGKTPDYLIETFFPKATLYVNTLEWWGVGVSLFDTLMKVKNKIEGSEDMSSLTSESDYLDLKQYFSRRDGARTLEELEVIVKRIQARHHKILEERIYTLYLGDSFEFFFPLLDYLFSYKVHSRGPDMLVDFGATLREWRSRLDASIE